MAVCSDPLGAPPACVLFDAVEPAVFVDDAEVLVLDAVFDAVFDVVLDPTLLLLADVPLVFVEADVFDDDVAAPFDVVVEVVFAVLVTTTGLLVFVGCVPV